MKCALDLNSPNFLLEKGSFLHRYHLSVRCVSIICKKVKLLSSFSCLIIIIIPTSVPVCDLASWPSIQIFFIWSFWFHMDWLESQVAASKNDSLVNFSLYNTHSGVYFCGALHCGISFLNVLNVLSHQCVCVCVCLCVCNWLAKMKESPDYLSDCITSYKPVHNLCSHGLPSYLSVLSLHRHVRKQNSMSRHCLMTCRLTSASATWFRIFIIQVHNCKCAQKLWF